MRLFSILKAGRMQAQRAWLWSVCYVLQWRGIFCLETIQATRAGNRSSKPQEHAKLDNAGTIKRKSTCFLCKIWFSSARRCIYYFNISFSADIIKPTNSSHLTICHLIISAQHYWISFFTMLNVTLRQKHGFTITLTVGHFHA